ncbi:MAG TPA: hypothetical protein VGP82_11030 [Ktedonobacterales bacterium]|jgi:hypothetical protein|nr:hypothetical protein [Ktedonobacterales bacterium]
MTVSGSGAIQVQSEGLAHLRTRLQAGGVQGDDLDEELAAVQRVGSQPTYAERVRQAITQPAALAARLIEVAPRAVSTLALIGIALLGIVSGVTLAFAVLSGSSDTSVALGDPQQLYETYAPRWAAGVVGLLAVLALMALVARYRRPGVLGLLAGLAGGITEVVLAALPWAAITGAQTTCDGAGNCQVASAVPLQIALLAAIYFAVPFTLALGGICAFAGLWLQRRRMEGAVRQATSI